ncbi:MAG: putative cytokinetic ring protein SteA [Clostridia bacterium]|nr:putative cytokinetic ring protein SteA [Clostridia bacterium]
MFYIKGKAKKDDKTKNLVKKIKKNEIAVIDHTDIDEIAAYSLIEKKVKLIINAAQSITGTYPSKGCELLENAGIFILDEIGREKYNMIKDGDFIELIEDNIYVNGKLLCKATILTKNQIEKKMLESRKNVKNELNKFIDNTLKYAKLEKDFFIDEIEVPNIKTNIYGRHVLVVIRGKNYKEDLMAIKSYIDEIKPVTIGVDGGADALIESGYKPDIVIGDMDSVSDNTLKKCKEIIVHAYIDGEAPGLKRIQSLGLKCNVFSFPGTSEDIAMILSYEKGAELIVTVGSHTSMIDFLEKGRPGMASTLLVRLKVGTKLVDAKGVSELYRIPLKFRYVAGVLIAAIFPIIVIVFFSPNLFSLYKLIELKLKLFLGW